MEPSMNPESKWDEAKLITSKSADSITSIPVPDSPQRAQTTKKRKLYTSQSMAADSDALPNKVVVASPDRTLDTTNEQVSSQETMDDSQDTGDAEEDDVEDDEDEEEFGEDSSTVLGDDDAESVVTRLISPALEREREARKTEDRKLLALLAHFDEEQLNRFETFRRATFAKASVRRLIQSVASCSVSQNVVVAMAGLTKVYIGEIVEEAIDYRERLGESGPLKPKHIREALRLLEQKPESTTSRVQNPLF